MRAHAHNHRRSLRALLRLAATTLPVGLAMLSFATVQPAWAQSMEQPIGGPDLQLPEIGVNDLLNQSAVVSSIELGADNGDIGDMIIDEYGFAWFTARSGVGRVGRLGIDRFDTVTAGDRSQVNEASSLVADPDSGIWSANGSLSYLDPWSGRVRATGLEADVIVPTTGGLWAWTPTAARFFNLADETVEPPIRLPDTLRRDLQPIATTDGDGNLHVAVGKELLIADRSGETYSHYLSGGIEAIAPRSGGGVWVSGSAGLWATDTAGERPRVVAELPDDAITSALIEAAPNRLLVATTGAILVYDPLAGEWLGAYPLSRYEPVRRLAFGHNGDLWLIQDDLLTQISPRINHVDFARYPAELGDPTSFAGDGTTMFVGTTHAEAYRYRPASGTWDKTPTDAYEFYFGTRFLLNALAVTPDHLWVALNHAEMAVMDREAVEPIQPYAIAPISWLTVDDEREEVWLAGEDFAAVDRFDRTRRSSSWNNGHPFDPPIGAVVLSSTRAYVPTATGIAVIDKADLSLIEIIEVNQLDGPATLLHVDEDRYLWAADDNDLVRIDLDDHQQTAFGPESGLPDSRILSLGSHPTLDALWIATGDGLHLLDYAGGHVTGRFGTYDGLGSSAFEAQPPVSLDDSTVVFATADGLVLLPPTFPSPGASASSRVYAECRAGCGADFDGRTVRNPNVVRFGILVPADAESGLRVQYRLKGLENEWSDAYETRSASYQNLDNGSYTFEVRALTGSGEIITPDPSQPGGPIRVEIPILIYDRASVRLAAAAIVITVFLASLGWRDHQSRSRHDELERVVAERTHEAEAARLEAEAARREAEEANDSKTQFLASVTHDLRTPLTAILGFAELAAERVDRPADGYVRNISTAATHLAGMISDLLLVARGTAEREASHGHLVDLSAVIDNVALMQQLDADRRGILITHRLNCPSPIGLPLEEAAVSRILMNLIGNAINYSDGSTVEIGLDLIGSQTTGSLLLSVTDDGGSLPPGDSDRLLDRFRRGPGAGGSGMGLGLSIVDDLVRSAGSRLVVEGDPGVYTRFSTELRIVATPTIDTTVAERLNMVEMVWVVDDDPLLLEFMSTVITEAGCQVERFGDAGAVTGRLAGPLPDCVVTDIMMSPVDGTTLAQELRRVGGDSVHIVAVTGHHELLDHAADLFNVVLRKPVSAQELRRAVDRHLGRSGLPARPDTDDPERTRDERIGRS